MNNTDANPYIGPRTFRKEEGSLFFGRESEESDLLALVVTEPLVLFYAQSGTGKSSLINTRLIPSLESRDFQVLPVGRVSGGDLPPGFDVDNVYLYHLMRSLVQREVDSEVLAKLSLRDFLAGLDQDQESYFYDSSLPQVQIGDAYTLLRRALIIDQFEELFTAHPEAWERREDCFRQLAQAMEDDPYLWVVLVMREDYIAHLDPYAHLLPGGLRVRYYMQRLEREAALRAIKSPALERNRPYADDVAEELLDELSRSQIKRLGREREFYRGQYVEPIVLQTVCYGLWGELKEGSQITKEDLEKIRTVSQALGEHYAKSLKDVLNGEVALRKGIKVREIREWFERELITVDGTRDKVAQEIGGKSGGLDDDIAQEFVKKGDIVRAEKSGGTTFYELTHDRLVEAILENNKKWDIENSSRFRSLAEEWVKSKRKEKYLLSDQALITEEQWANENLDKLSPTEVEFLEASREKQELKEREEKRQHDEQQRQLEMAQKLADMQARDAQRARQFTRFAIAGVIVAFILAFAAGWAMINAQNSADVAATKAAEARIAEATALAAEAAAQDLADTAQARELASAAEANLNLRLDLSILLSLEAYKTQPDTPQAQSAVFDSMQRALRLRGFLATSEDPAEKFIYSPDEQFIAVLKKDGITLWKVSEDGLKKVENSDPIPGSNTLEDFNYGYYGNQFIFSPDGDQLIFLNRAGLNYWDVHHPEMINKMPINGHKGSIAQIVFNADTSTVATRGENGEFTLWNLDKILSGDVSSTKSPSYQGDVVAFSPDGKKLAVLDAQQGSILTGDVDWKVDWLAEVRRIEDGGKRARLKRIEQEPDMVTSIAFNSGGDILALGLKDGNITLWDLTNDTELDSINTDTNSAILSLTFNLDGNYLTYDTASGTRILNLEDLGVSGEPIQGTKLNISPNGDTLAFSVITNNKNQIDLRTVAGNNVFSVPIDGDMAVFSPDSRTMAISHKSGNTINLVDVNTGAIIGMPIPTQVDHFVNTMAFSQDGKLLAVGTINGGVELWDIASPMLISSEPPQTGSVSSLAFSPDGAALIVGRVDSEFSVLEINPKELDVISSGNKTNYLGRITGFSFSPDEQFLYSIANDGILILRNTIPDEKIIPGNTLPEFIGTEKKISTVVVRNEKNEIILWDIDGNEPLSDDPIPGISYQLSPNEGILVAWQETGSDSEKIRSFVLWNTRNGKKINAEPIRGDSVIFSRSRNFIAVQSRQVEASPESQSLFSLWNALSGKQISESVPGNEVIFSPNGGAAAIYSLQTNKFDLWNLPKGMPIGSNMDGKPEFAPKQPLVASAFNGTITFRETSQGVPINIDPPIQGGKVIFSPDGKHFVTNTASEPSSDSSNRITVWETERMKPIGNTIPGRIASNVYSNCPSIRSMFGIGPDDSIMVVSNTAGITLWDIKTGEFLDGPLSGRECMLLSPQGRFLVLYNNNTSGGIIWDLKMSTQIATFFGIYKGFISDEKILVTANSDNRIRFWDLTTGNQIGGPVGEQSGQPIINVRLAPPHTGIPNDLVFSPETHKHFAIFNLDKSISVWNTHTLPSIPGTLLNIHNSSNSIVTTALSADGNRMAVSTQDKIKLFINAGNNKFSPQKEFSNKHIKEAASVALSPEGTRLASTYRNHPSFSLWDISAGTAEPPLETIDEAANSLFFSPNGEVIASSPGWYMYWLREASSGKTIGYPLFGENLQFSPPNGQYAGIYYGGFTMIYDSTSGNQIGEPVPGYFVGFRSEADAEASTVIIRSGTEITLWNFIEKSKQTIPIGNYSYRISPDGRLMMTTTNTGAIAIWDLEKRRELPEIKEFRGELGVFSSYNPNNPDKRLMSLYNYEMSGYVLYEITLPATVNRIGDEDSALPNPTFSPNGEYAVTSAYHRIEITVLETASGVPIKSIPGHYFQAFGNEDSILITTRPNDKRVYFWNMADPNKAHEPFRYSGTLYGVSVSKNGRILAVFGNDGIALIDLTTLHALEPYLKDETGVAQKMVFSPNGNTLATVGTDGLILWSLAGPDPVALPRTLKGQSGSIADVRFTRDGSVVYLDSKGTVYKLALGDIEKFKEESELETGVKNACLGSLSPYGTYVAKQAGKELAIWDALQDTDNPIKELDIKDASCDRSIAEFSMAFSLQEKSFAYSNGRSNRIYVLTPNDAGEAFASPAELIGKLEDNPPYYDLAFLYGENSLISRAGGHSVGRRIFLWDIRNRTQVAASDQAGEPILFMDGKMLIYLRAENQFVSVDLTSDELDETLKKWRDELCKRVEHNPFPTELSQYLRENAENHEQTCQ